MIERPQGFLRFFIGAPCALLPKKDFSMKPMLIAITALASSMLSGCAGLPSGAGAVAELAELSRRAWAREDAAQARLVDSARGVVSWRTPRLAPYPETASAIKRACSRGVLVEIFVASEARSQTSALQGTCAELYVSNQPEVATQGSFVLVDSDQAMLKGKQEWLPTKLHAQELLFRHQLRMTSWRQP
jgi:hypothetical protein